MNHERVIAEAVKDVASGLSQHVRPLVLRKQIGIISLRQFENWESKTCGKEGRTDAEVKAAAKSIVQQVLWMWYGLASHV